MSKFTPEFIRMEREIMAKAQRDREGFIDPVMEICRDVNAVNHYPEALDEITRLTAELEAAKAARWISVKDRLPDIETVVWGYYRSRTGNDTVDEVYLADDGEWITNTLLNHPVAVSHWMEIVPPEPPALGKEG